MKFCDIFEIEVIKMYSNLENIDNYRKKDMELLNRGYKPIR